MVVIGTRDYGGRERSCVTVRSFLSVRDRQAGRRTDRPADGCERWGGGLIVKDRVVFFFSSGFSLGRDDDGCSDRTRDY